MTLAAETQEDEARQQLARRFLGWPSDQRREWLLRQPPDVVEEVEAAVAEIIDPLGLRHYRLLDYEPICRPRVEAALEAGYSGPVEAEAAGMELPPMCGLCPAERFDRSEAFDVLFGGAAGGSKELRLDEPVPTPDGWTTVGDLRPGDCIFADTGQPTTVTAVHPVDFRPAAYRLTFDDGSTVEACADHLWLSFDAAELAALTRRDPEWRARRRVKRPKRGTGAKPWLAERNTERASGGPAPAGTVRTTKEIVATLRTVAGRANHAMPVAAPLVLPEADLPLDPYVLGLWLGDGASAGGCFSSVDPEVVEAFRAAGFRVHKVRGDNCDWSTTGLMTQLRGLGVLGNKHIPSAYLRASRGQRLALLQGLMDTDGCATRAGSVCFTNTNRRIVDAAYELVVSLGWKAQIRERRARIDGRDCGPVWSIKWTPSEYVFRLPRKRGRQRLATRRTTRFRYVVEAEECAPAPMRCLTVDSPSGLFLVGRSMLVTHNTKSAVMFTIRCMARWPGFRALFLRETYDQLDENVFPELLKIDHAKAVGGRWEAGRRTLWIGQSSCRFRYLADSDDALQRRGGSYQLITFDEANLLPRGVRDGLRDRLRSADVRIPVIGFRSTANPGGRSHGELKEQFVTPTDYGQHAITITVGRAEFQREYIPAKSTDNPYLGPDYEEQVLGGIEDPVLRAAMKDGDWDKFSGQFFSEWNRELHIVPRFDIPRGWMRYSGTDYGLAAPWAHLSAARDSDGRVWLYREQYAAGRGEREQARIIREAEQATGERGVQRYADPNMWGKTGDADPVAETYKLLGVPLIPAVNDRSTGWARVHTFLNNGVEKDGELDMRYAACAIHREQGLVTCPLLHVLEGTCPELVRTLPDLPFDKHKVEDLDTDAEDHAADALRYLLIMLPLQKPRRRKLMGQVLAEAGVR